MKPSNSKAGGVFLMLGSLGGFVAGTIAGHALGGAVLGTAAGVFGAIAVWLVDRKRS